MATIHRDINRVRLGEFLRSRRARRLPHDYQLPTMPRRRTPGLRREEVSQLTGISIAYYTWIEQGRDINISVEVLNAIARALQLTMAERTHLFTLAGLGAPEIVDVDGHGIHPSIAHLFEDASRTCVMMYDRWFNLVAWSPLAQVVFSESVLLSFERNLLVRLFCDPAGATIWTDWESEARIMVGMLRQTLARHPDSPEGVALFETLSTHADFQRIWEAFDVRLRPSPEEYFRDEPWELTHRTAGALRIHRLATSISTRDERTLAIFTPADAETLGKFDHLATRANGEHLALLAVPA